MQRTVYDHAVTPARAKRLVPALAAQYPAKTHETTLVPYRDGNLKRVRIVVSLKGRRRRR